MAERRMFTQKITEADNFTALPPTTKCLYFHLCMNADDDGFSNKIRQAMFNAHADQNDFEMLISKRFILPFDSGVIVIKHWRMHNLIRNDRYHETDYVEEKAKLVLKENGVYTDNLTYGLPSDNQMTTKCLPSDNQMEPEVRLGKDSIGKLSIEKEKVKKKKSNLALFEEMEDEERIIPNEELRECFIAWLKYKDEKKNHYTQTGLEQLIKKFLNADSKYGTNAIIAVVNDSMASNYQGIVWDRLDKFKPQQTTSKSFIDTWKDA